MAASTAKEGVRKAGQEKRLTVREAMDAYKARAQELLAAERTHGDARAAYDAALAARHTARHAATAARKALSEACDRHAGILPGMLDASRESL